MRDKTFAEKGWEWVGLLIYLAFVVTLFYFILHGDFETFGLILEEHYPNNSHFIMIVFILGIMFSNIIIGWVSSLFETTELSLKIAEIKSKYRAIRTPKNKTQNRRDMHFEIRKAELASKLKKAEDRYNKRNLKDKIDERFK